MHLLYRVFIVFSEVLEVSPLESPVMQGYFYSDPRAAMWMEDNKISSIWFSWASPWQSLKFSVAQLSHGNIRKGGRGSATLMPGNEGNAPKPKSTRISWQVNSESLRPLKT